MSNTNTACPQCTLENTYPDADNWVCADCGFEWHKVAATPSDDDADAVVKDSNGQVLQDGDAVVLIKDLKVKRLVHGAENGHQGQEHPAGWRRPRGGLQNGRWQLYAESLLPEKGLNFS